VVLVHGFSVPYYIWDPTFEALEEAGFRVLRFDLFGRGFSDRPFVPYDRELFDRQLGDLLDCLEISNPVNLIGLSMGGVISSTFTVRHPERVARLGLFDPAGFPLGYSMVFKLMKVPGLGEFVTSIFGSANLENSVASDFYRPKNLAPFLMKYRPQMQYKGFRRALLSTMRKNKALYDSHEIYQQLGQLDLPVILIWGEQDLAVPFVHSETFIKIVPQAEFHPVALSGHIPHYEHPEIVNPSLIEFLKR
jgi:pimeloyl-ACP methyl ester carboxylesterase